jgi:hypothetical protein
MAFRTFNNSAPETKVFVGGIPREANANEIKANLAGCGQAAAVRIRLSWTWDGQKVSCPLSQQTADAMPDQPVAIEIR